MAQTEQATTEHNRAGMAHTRERSCPFLHLGKEQTAVQPRERRRVTRSRRRLVVGGQHHHRGGKEMHQEISGCSACFFCFVPDLEDGLRRELHLQRHSAQVSVSARFSPQVSALPLLLLPPVRGVWPSRYSSSTVQICCSLHRSPRARHKLEAS